MSNVSHIHHTVDPKFVIPRQGKQMVLYVGLLDAAHRAGMVSMETEILQYPNAANEQTCIVRATVTLIADDDHRGIYTGIGDANPKNVGGTIVPHFIRMAETRAKARALRDALNVGMVTVEELGDDRDDDAHSAPQPRQQPPARAPRPPAPSPHPAVHLAHALTDHGKPAPGKSDGLPIDMVLANLRDMDEERVSFKEITAYAWDQALGFDEATKERIKEKLRAIGDRRKAEAAKQPAFAG